GVPLLYYGQELGMKGKQMKGTTDGNDIAIREAFEWNATATGAGMAFWYTNTGPWWDSTNVKPNDGISVEEQKRDPNSLWNYYRKMIQLKKSSKALASGQYSAVENNNEKIFSFLRSTGKDQVLVVVNLGDGIEETTIKVNAKSGKNLLKGEIQKFDSAGFLVRLQPYEVQVYQLKN
nr:alpha-glucosidase C-terminal domain-containing protein [Chryseolinea sp.]